MIRFFDVVKYWVLRTVNWFKLEGFIILLSSEKILPIKSGNKTIFTLRKRSYHVVFNCRVSWRMNIKIMSWVAIQSQILKVKDYALMQGIKMSSTLRVSPKGEKPSPRIVYRSGKQNKQIKKYLDNRQFIKDTIRELKQLSTLKWRQIYSHLYS